MEKDFLSQFVRKHAERIYCMRFQREKCQCIAKIAMWLAKVLHIYANPIKIRSFNGTALMLSQIKFIGTEIV